MMATGTLFVTRLVGSMMVILTMPTPLPVALTVSVQLFVFGAMPVVEVKLMLPRLAE